MLYIKSESHLRRRRKPESDVLKLDVHLEGTGRAEFPVGKAALIAAPYEPGEAIVL